MRVVQWLFVFFDRFVQIYVELKIAFEMKYISFISIPLCDLKHIYLLFDFPCFENACCKCGSPTLPRKASETKYDECNTKIVQFLPKNLVAVEGIQCVFCVYRVSERQ